MYNNRGFPDVVVPGNSATISFVTDSSYVHDGFELVITGITGSSGVEESSDKLPFEDMKDIIDAESARLLAIGKNRNAGKMKKTWKRMVSKKYGWFEEYADDNCSDPAGQGAGQGVDYAAPTSDPSEACASIHSFYGALAGYYDDFLCNDRIPKRKAKAGFKANQAKKVFNFALTTMGCSETVA